MSNFLAEPVRLFPIRPNRTIGGISGYVTIDESANDKLTITKHPVQQGAMISDHAYLEPAELTVRIVAGENQKPLSELYADFRKLQSDRVPFDVVTGKRSYSNMMITALAQTTDKLNENVLALNIQMSEVIIVQVTPTTVPARKNQSNAGKTGATEKAGKKSALKVLKEGIGNLFGGA